MNDTQLRLIEIIITGFFTLISSGMGLLASYKLINYRVQKQEEAQKQLEEKQNATDDSIVTIQLAVTKHEGKLEEHDDRIAKVENRQEELQKYHMKKE